MAYEGEILLVSNIVVHELRIKVIDCRSNAAITNAMVKKIALTIGSNKEIIEEFDRTADKDALTTTGAEGSIDALKKLGYGINDAKKTTYSEGVWRDHYNSYWSARVAGFTKLKTDETPSDAMMEYIKKEYNSHRCTDENGVLCVQIPILSSEGATETTSVKVEVGFWDFPVVLEGTVSRPNENRATEFSVRWNGTQSTEWNKGFGWEIHYNNASDELKVSEEMATQYNSESQDFDITNPSKFYKKDDSNTGHFALLAMQWCQPVWDGIDDNGTSQNTANGSSVYIQDNNYRDLNMHIVTCWHGGSKKTYGTTRHRDNHSWVVEAIDIHTINGQTVEFAVHAGNVALRYDSPSAGNYVTLSWGGANLQLRYFHMASFSVAAGYVMCGRIVGIAGRTGNFPDKYPCHVHLDDGQTDPREGIIVNRDTAIDEHNRFCIPIYDYPMLFPCYCGIPSTNHNASGCDFSKTNIVTDCWAVGEMRCPHMLGENKRNRRIQAQLRQLDYYTKSIDGQWGSLPTSATSAMSNTRQGIYNFKNDNNLLVALEGQTFNPANYDMDPVADDPILNNLVPLNIA